jgi:hypothetical protein
MVPAIAHKGVYRYRCCVRGKEAHSSLTPQSVNAIEMGARMGEIQAMCAPLTEAAKQPDAAGTAAFRETWVRMANQLSELAAEDEARGRLISAGDKLNRAATYLITAERLLAHGSEGRLALYQQFLQTFRRGVELTGENCEFVRIPYEGQHLSGLFVRAHGVTGPAPILVQVNGLDSTKEMKYRVGLPAWLAQRGVASLIIDQPGTGEALRLQGLTARYDSEHWASRVVDWLEQHPAVDPLRIGCEGVSLGGYYCPRSVAMEPRFACGVAWGSGGSNASAAWAWTMQPSRARCRTSSQRSRRAWQKDRMEVGTVKAVKNDGFSGWSQALRAAQPCRPAHKNRWS